MLITKADGTKEEFNPNKLRRSLKHAGAGNKDIAHILENLKLTDGMTTDAIYRQAFSMLHKETVPVAATYSLTRAVADLGPTGFPFEDFLARIFEAEGYKTKVRLTLKGKCATHEIDVAAYSPKHSFIAEAKFHARKGTKSDIQTTLYSYARYMDLKDRAVCTADTCGIIDLMIVTNTKFTTAAINYAECAGLQLLSWNYPKGKTLQDRIAATGFFPITVLKNLTQKEKAALLQAGVILCRDITKKPEKLRELRVARGKEETVLEEARQLCTGI